MIDTVLCKKFPGNAAKKEWKKLRNGLREAVKRQKTTTGQERTNVKPWKYQKQMEFVIPQMKNRKRVSNLVSPVQSEHSNEEEHVDSPAETTHSIQGEATEEDHEEKDEESEETIKHEQKRRRTSQNENNSIINFLTQQQETREKRQKERDNMRKLIEQNDDPLLEFFQSMYKSTKVLPRSSQLNIKHQFFNTVLEEEERVEASKQNIRSASSLFQFGSSLSYASPSPLHVDVQERAPYYETTPTPQNVQVPAQGSSGSEVYHFNHWPGCIETNQQNEGNNGESYWGG